MSISMIGLDTAKYRPTCKKVALANALQAICDVELGELQAIDPPRGFGRD